MGRSTYCTPDAAVEGSEVCGGRPTPDGNPDKGAATKHHLASPAAQAEMDGLSLSALRFRGIRFWLAGIGVLSIVSLYVNPAVIAAVRMPSRAHLPSAPLPDIAVPLFRFPTLGVP